MGQKIGCLFVDIGGVLLSNSWDKPMRERACEKFDIGFKELDERHILAVGPYETGSIDLDTYLDLVVFYAKRRFTREEFKSYIVDQSKPFKEMLNYLHALKEYYQLKLVAISNEGRELSETRIRNFGLAALFDAFVGSCFIHRRKPDPEMYKIALDIAQVTAERVLYIDDRPLFIEAARRFGIRGVVHREYLTTRKELVEWGFALESGGSSGFTGGIG